MLYFDFEQTMISISTIFAVLSAMSQRSVYTEVWREFFLTFIIRCENVEREEIDGKNACTSKRNVKFKTQIKLYKVLAFY